MKFLSKSEKITSKKMYFCGERPLDLNLDDFGGAGSSVGELFGPEKDADGSNATQGMGGL